MVSRNAASNLNDERHNGFSVFRILLELFLVVSVLAERPDGHLIEAGRSEQANRQALAHQREAAPRADLVRVVRTRDVVEQDGERIGGWHRYLSLSSAGRSQVTQRRVNTVVADLAEQKTDQAEVDLQVAEKWRGVERMVDVVANVEREAPVVRAVLKRGGWKFWVNF